MNKSITKNPMNEDQQQLTKLKKIQYLILGCLKIIIFGVPIIIFTLSYFMFQLSEIQTASITIILMMIIVMILGLSMIASGDSIYD